jgi:hypothetical protein
MTFRLSAYFKDSIEEWRSKDLAARQRAQQIKPLLFASFAAADAGVGFIDDDEIRTLECAGMDLQDAASGRL